MGRNFVIIIALILIITYFLFFFEILKTPKNIFFFFKYKSRPLGPFGPEHPECDSETNNSRGLKDIPFDVTNFIG